MGSKYFLTFIDEQNKTFLLNRRKFFFRKMCRTSFDYQQKEFHYTTLGIATINLRILINLSGEQALILEPSQQREKKPFAEVSPV
jgi:hypothetical protein